ncbi:hypothetical protein [Tessaracoccus flavus]|uniref:Uncharacterized protein n=1 Tax=Tessaracoccus flavus TaxID=1610493 RepID=A0A1Q2CG88_9ACTN|nr:hypothetical protein [Tessaracoccus flavus]AQP45131.1 hypothetical protein RPIT_10280 [Tessaracoccus flavus]SDY55553.1 hypothetical protein SAMN05428934_102249 [Tessaracoccus flavus]
MAEIRKFDPGAGDGIQKLVREALGENVRPVNPWEAAQPSGDQVAAEDGTGAGAVSDIVGYDFGVVALPDSPDEP